MGKARAGTEGNYGKREVILSDHANEQLRNRLRDLGCSDFNSDTDESLANRVDKAVSRARKDSSMQSFIERTPTGDVQHYSCSMEEEFGVDLWPLIRKNTVVTVLTKTQVQKSLEVGKWRPEGNVLRANSPFAALATHRGHVPPAPVPATVSVSPEPPPASTASPPSAGFIVVNSDDLMDNSYDSAACHLDKYAALEDAAGRMERGHHPRLFVEVTMRTRRKIVVEID